MGAEPTYNSEPCRPLAGLDIQDTLKATRTNDDLGTAVVDRYFGVTDDDSGSKSGGACVSCGNRTWRGAS